MIHQTNIRFADVLKKFRKGWVSLLFCLLLTMPLHAQIPHGISRPMPEGSEKVELRSAVDYFVEMPPLDVDSAMTVDDLPGNRIGGLRFAHTFFTNIAPENSGIVFITADGTRIWKVGIRSNGAYTINVLFSEYDIPEEASLFLYNPDRSVVLGPFTNANRPEGGEFSVSPVAGDELIVEYHEPSTARYTGKIRITEVNHDYRGLFRAAPKYNTLNMPCQPDVSCNGALDTIRRSTCLLIINGNTYCTGTLLNNTAKDGTPYIITASHCLNNSAVNGSRVVVFMNYESPRCDPRIRGSDEFSLSGSVCRALSNEVDFALLELLETPPSDYRPWLAGWSRSTDSISGKPYNCIHHPNGDTKKYCTEEDNLATQDWSTSGIGIMPGNHWHIRYWEKGHTWGGSSGAGLFDNKSRLIGGLTGGDSGGATGCGDYPEGDYFFRMDRAWDQFPEPSRQLKHWLDPLTSDGVKSTVSAIDGMDPYETNPSKRISNIQATDSLSSITVLNGQGSIFGHNSLRTTIFAEHFEVADSSSLQGAYLIAAKGTNTTNKPIYISVLSGGEKPGVLLAKQLLNPDYINYVGDSFLTTTKASFTNRENFIRFSKPVFVGKNFFIAYEIKYPTSSKDSFYLYGAIRNNAFNSAFIKQNGEWVPYTMHPTNPINTSLWIEPVIQRSKSNSGGDTITYTATERPIVFWSNNKSALMFDFPPTWIESTSVEVFNLFGTSLLKTTIQPPSATVPFSVRMPGLILIRLNNGLKVFTYKIMTE